ncbi:MAG: hypothetical protein ABIG42_01875 [bacterium]
MKTKKILSVILIVFVVVSLGFLFAKESGKNKTTTSSDNSILSEEVTPDNPEASPDIPIEVNASRDAGTEDKFIVYYFHITKRCATCLRIEKYFNEAIITGFLPEMTIGKLEFSSINTDLLKINIS